ncbi:hypothetical protein BASA60_004547 [Batrachochytrium salamandrivorans]|nr:hypothetical protein BASA60_004547 [Batrachochytrium salamandrivorans]
MKFNILVIAAMVIASDAPQESDHTTKKPAQTCGDILKELQILWMGGQNLNNVLQRLLPEFFALIAEESDGEESDEDENDEDESVKGKEHKKEDSKSSRVQSWIELHPEFAKILENIQTKFIELEEAYDKTWQKLLDQGCLVEELQHVSPASAMEKKHFPKW